MAHQLVPLAPVSAAVVLEEQGWFTLAALCQASGAEHTWVQAMVGEGLLQPTGHMPQDWRFGGDALPQTRKTLRLARDFELDMAAVALVLELMAEIERLRLQLRAT